MANNSYSSKCEFSHTDAGGIKGGGSGYQSENKQEPELTVKLWLWKNGDYFWAFDNLYPCHYNGDPMTLGEPIGYALFRPSVNGRLNYEMKQDEDKAIEVGAK